MTDGQDITALALKCGVLFDQHPDAACRQFMIARCSTSDAPGSMVKVRFEQQHHSETKSQKQSKTKTYRKKKGGSRALGSAAFHPSIGFVEFGKMCFEDTLGLSSCIHRYMRCSRTELRFRWYFLSLVSRNPASQRTRGPTRTYRTYDIFVINCLGGSTRRANCFRSNHPELVAKKTAFEPFRAFEKGWRFLIYGIQHSILSGHSNMAFNEFGQDLWSD